MPKIIEGLVLRERLGTFETSDGTKGEMCLNVSGSPMVKIGDKFVAFPWEELIEQAQKLIEEEQLKG